MLAWSAHISMLYTELPYVERVGAARAAGFDWIETMWPESGDIDGLVAAVQEHGPRVAVINAYGGDLTAGRRGLINDPARRDEAEQAFAEAAVLAGRLGAANVHVLTGITRADLPRDEQWAAAVEVLRAGAALAKQHDLTILIESINEHDVPGYLTPTLATVTRLIDDVDRPEVRLMFDAYHVARAGDDPVAEVAAHVDRIGHVQFADCPGRGAPGSGALDVWAFADALDRAGYAGPVGLEFRPGGPTPPTLEFLRDARPPAPFALRA